MTGVGWLRAGVLSLLALGGGRGFTVPKANAQSTDGTRLPQLIPRTSKEREQLYRAEHRVVLNVIVTGASGNAIAGLKPGDFTLLDKGHLQQITSFHEVDGQDAASTVHVTLVIDGINTQDDMGFVRKELNRFFSPVHVPLSLPVTLAVLSHNGVAEGQPSTDRRVLADQLAQLTRHVEGFECSPLSESASDTCAQMRFSYSMNLLNNLAMTSQSAKGRSLLIWIGPGWPLPEDDGIGYVMANWRHGNVEAIAALKTALREANVTLDAVTWWNFEMEKGVHRAEEDARPGVDLSPVLALPVLDRDTGGQAIAKSKNLGDAIDTFLADGSRYYVLTFDSVPSPVPDEFHPIEVKVDKPGVTVRTTTAYYAQP